MKKIFAALLLVLVSCSTLKERDVDYRVQKHANSVVVVEKHPDWSDAVFACLKTKDSTYAYGSCVGIGYDAVNNKTYLATAYHIIHGNVRYVKGEGKIFKIDEIISHPKRDIGFLVIEGKLPITKVFEGVPDSDFDITIGYINGDFNNKGSLAGVAVPGQSGGGVFSNKFGLFGVVSTTGEAVAIWPALKDLHMEYVTRLN